jgi:hypothetical protein
MDSGCVLYEYYVGYCLLSTVYLIYMTFRELAVLPSSGDWLLLYWQICYLFNRNVLTVGTKSETTLAWAKNALWARPCLSRFSWELGNPNIQG